MKSTFLKLFLFLFFQIILSCKNEEPNNKIINKGTPIEFRNNNKYDKGKLELIKNSSEKFDKLVNYFNTPKNFKKTDQEINIFPNYILINRNLKILISLDLIYVEYKNFEGKNIKLFKTITPEEYSYFHFLSQNNEWIYDLGKVYGKGKFKNASYNFCGLMLTKENYQYKIGKWKFWNLKRELIAEGEFTIDSSLVKGQGGCDFYIKTSKIKKENWKFYNSNHELIEPNFEDIFILENTNQ
ncbi:hypothetical protein [Flavobacterium sp.]|uniref:hypothetical protein n=3 Tax=Flavobacterium sp. TaxID=239 RepID=UPI004048CC35